VIAAGSVAGAAFVLGAVVGIRALAINPGSNARTGGGVTIAGLQAAARTAHGDAIFADVSFAIAAVAAGTALLLYFTTPRRSPPGGAQVARIPPQLKVTF
jgi:hypothetical protein